MLTQLWMLTCHKQGIGNFTIADDAIVKDADLGVNFFLDEQCLGKPRSKCCADLLQELNPDVKGNVRGLCPILVQIYFNANHSNVAVH